MRRSTLAGSLVRSLAGSLAGFIVALACAFAPAVAAAANLYLDPSSGSYGPGDTFIVNIRLGTDAGQCINAGHIILDYPVGSVRAVDFGRGSSIFSLWISDPKIDTDAGVVDFSGGVPGGYCGRIPGDPALSNILGSVVFTVVSSTSRTALLHFDPASVLYANDGLGTEVAPTFGSATISIARTSVASGNPWIDAVSSDTVAPEPFVLSLESTGDVFDGKYYVVFSTVDKQSGLDHYEAYQKGVWVRVMSPYVLADQSLKDPIEVRAIDKAGNARMGTYVKTTPPPRQYSLRELLLSIAVLVVLILALALGAHMHHRHRRSIVLDQRS